MKLAGRNLLMHRAPGNHVSYRIPWLDRSLKNVFFGQLLPGDTAMIRLSAFFPLALFLWLIGGLLASHAGATETLTLGVLASRPKPMLEARWQPLAEYLNRNLPGKSVKLQILTESEMEAALTRSDLDFIFTTPSHYTVFRQKNRLSGALATLVDLESNQPLATYGGTLFTLQTRTDIAKLEDIKGKTLASAGRNYLGGYQAPAFELAQAGVNLPADVRLLVTGEPHDAVVQAVLEGRADAGAVSTGVLESMARHGQLDPGKLRIVNPQNLPGFPFDVSTHLYPQWPFAALPHIDERLARRVAALLLAIEPDDPVAKLTGIYGFAIPADYTPVEEVMRTLRLPPFDRMPTFTPVDVWQRYQYPLIALAGTVVIIALLSIRLAIGNRRLAIARRQARNSEAKLAAILDNVGGYIYIKDTGYRYQFANRALCELFGATLADVIGREDSAFFDTATSANLRINDRRVIEDGERIEVTETNVLERSGKKRSYLSVKLPLLDNAGRIYALCGISTDITLRKNMEDTLLREKLRYESLLKTASDGIHVLDSQGRLVEASRSFYRMLGFPEDSALNVKDWNDHWNPEELLTRTVDVMGLPQTFETQYRRADGKMIDVEITAHSVLIDGQMLIYAAARDITDRKNAEEEIKRSNDELEQFAYAISHDLRQPLRMVTSYLQLIESALRDKLDEETSQFIHFAVDGAQRMDQMILSLLEFSRIGRKTEPLSPLFSRDVLEEALGFLGPEITASGGKVQVTGEWPELIASRDELSRLFQNLIGNALKYHEENQPPEVTVDARNVGELWRVEVRDQGIGIEPSQIGRLFQVFSRLQSRVRYEGTGVGLALCRKIIEHHRGEIGVESAGPGLGSTFWFSLPLPVKKG